MADKKRLIDANALMDAFRKYMAERFDSERCVSEENCMVCDRVCLWRRIVKDAPTVDAVEVVRGRWEDEHGGKYANPRYRCSACKGKALYKFERDLLGNYKEVQALTPCCPYCMAKLDGGVGNDI